MDVPNNIKAFAENWFKPRLEESRARFPQAVQAKLAEFAARGTAISPPAHAAVEGLAFAEVERTGQLFLAGYKEAFAAVSHPISPATLEQIKADLDALLSSESVRVLKTIQYVRDVCKPFKTMDAVELRARTQQKLVAELDLFVAKLNTQRGIPTFGWKPDSVTFLGTYQIYEQGKIASPEDLQGLIELLYDQPECEVRYYYQDGSSMDPLLADAILNRDILVKKSERRFFKLPEGKRNYAKIPSGDYKFDWQKDVAEKTPEFVQVTLGLSHRKRNQIDTINKVQLEEHYHGNIFRRHPIRTLLLAAISFLFSFLPQWGASVWSLFSARPLVPYLLEKIPAFEKVFVGFNWNIITMPIGLGGFVLLVWLVVKPRWHKRSIRVADIHKNGGP
jgi:hypothetical protein